MTYAIHPVWETTGRPESMRYGLYRVSATGEIEIARASRLESVENLRQQLLQSQGKRRPW
ncbi:hypothetical protein [Chitinibacter sp. S2-10]|uniref:hypothetical protein n=1 Tax=Chitinibacter sp. S2-10 TaxID=3373597 RepID=UPI003977C67F